DNGKVLASNESGTSPVLELGVAVREVEDRNHQALHVRHVLVGSGDHRAIPVDVPRERLSIDDYIAVGEGDVTGNGWADHAQTSLDQYLMRSCRYPLQVSTTLPSWRTSTTGAARWPSALNSSALAGSASRFR